MIYFINDTIYHLEYGKLHRNNGPALINKERIEYYQNGLLHNESGPARLNLVDRSVEFWHNGECICDKTVIVDDLVWQKYISY